VIGHRVVLRPRSLSETGDLTSAVLRRHPAAYAKLLPWVLVPAVGSWLLHRFAGWGPDEALLLEIGLLSLGSGVYTLLAGDLMLQSDVKLGELQKRYAKLLPGYLFKRVASWVTLVLSLFLAFGWSAFVPEAALLERGSLGASMSRSAALLRSTPGRTITWGAVALAIMNVGVIAAELGYHELRSMLGLAKDLDTLSTKQFSWAPFVGLALAVPYLATMRFLLYIDCRTRREGWDLQVQMAALVQVSEKTPERLPLPKTEAA
jgi:hypothetical protein